MSSESPNPGLPEDGDQTMPYASGSEDQAVPTPGPAAPGDLTLGGGAGATIVDEERARRLREQVEDVWGDSISPKTDTQSSIKSPGTYSTTASRVVLKSRTLKDKRKEAGESLGADYEIIGLLGEGGMGVVYEARQASVDRNIAIKMVKQRAADDPQARTQLLSEASVTGNLTHPNIVPIHDLGIADDGTLFYAMKKVDGTPWKKVMGEKDLQENIDILLRVCDAVAFAHSRGVIHRDLKPENIMLGEYGEVLVMDWGLAASVAQEGKAEPISHLSASGGTPCYMAPEMAAGDPERIGKHSDIYLLGAILYKLVTGLAPHHGESVVQCLMHAAENVIQPAPMSCELVDIATRAMATKPEERYAEVRDFQEAIREYLRHFESINLASHAQENFAQAKREADYDRFAQVLYGFRESLELWSDNTEARAHLSQVQRAYAECALAKGDLDLAQSLLEADDPAHAELHERVADAQALARLRRWRVRMLTAGVIGTAAALFVAISAGLYFVNAQKNRAIAAEAEAVAEKVKTKDALQQVQKEKENTVLERNRAIAAEAKAMDAYAQAEQALAVVLRERAKALGHGESAKTQAEIKRLRDALLREKRLVKSKLRALDPAEAKRKQETAAAGLGMQAQLDLALGKGATLSLVLIPDGEFIMGSPPGEEFRDNQELLHRVHFTEPFYMSKYEVTQAQWQAVAGRNPSGFQDKPDAVKCPVENVSFDDILQQFLPKVQKHAPAGFVFRLPSEAEWEYACRAGSREAFFPGSGSVALAGCGWFSANSGRTSHRVGEKHPNAWGLHDTHGNVAEWCLDVYDQNYYVSGVEENPVNTKGDAKRIVIRGGSWINLPKHCRSAYRSWTRRDRRYTFLGFRLACVPAARQ